MNQFASFADLLSGAATFSGFRNSTCKLPHFWSNMTFAEDVVRAVPIRAKMRASRGAFVWLAACKNDCDTACDLSEGHRG